MRTMNTGDFSSAGELERKLMNSAGFFHQVLVSPLHDAAARGDVERLQELLDHPEESDPAPSLLTLDNAKNTALHWASGSGHAETVRFLIERGETTGSLLPLLHAQNLLGDTALHRAVWRGHKEVVELLLNAGIDRDVANTMGQTALELVRDHVGIGCLLQRGRMLPGVSSGDDDDATSEEDAEEGQVLYRAGDEPWRSLNLSDTEYSSEDESIGSLLVEKRMNDLFQPPTPSTEEGEDDDVPPLSDEEEGGP